MDTFQGVVLGGSAGAGGPARCFWGPGDTYTSLVTGEESGGTMFAMDCVLDAVPRPSSPRERRTRT